MTAADLGPLALILGLGLAIWRIRMLQAERDWIEVQAAVYKGELDDALARLASGSGRLRGPKRRAVEELIVRRRDGEAYPEEVDQVLLALVSRIEDLEAGRT